MADVLNAIEMNAADYRESYRRSFPDPGWWVLFPDWMRGDVDKIKAKWYGLAGHPLGNLRGFEFWDGPRYTYDQGNDTWTTDEESHWQTNINRRAKPYDRSSPSGHRK